jgi:hypothetical protein
MRFFAIFPALLASVSIYCRYKRIDGAETTKANFFSQNLITGLKSFSEGRYTLCAELMRVPLVSLAILSPGICN